MLKEFQHGIKNDFENKEEQIQILVDQVNKFKKDKKDAVSIVKQRDIELVRANKRITELQR